MPGVQYNENASATLAGSATANGSTRDIRHQQPFGSPGLTGYLPYRKIAASSFGTQAGTLNLQASTDGTTWFTIGTAAMTANIGAQVVVDVAFPFYRAQFVNGASAQTKCALFTTLYTS